MGRKATRTWRRVKVSIKEEVVTDEVEFEDDTDADLGGLIGWR